MNAQLTFRGKTVTVNLNEAIDLSIPMHPRSDAVLAWYLDPLTIEPVRGDGFVGEVKQGGSVNFRTISFNPHGHGTHTESLGHITNEIYSVNRCVKNYFHWAELITIEPEKRGEDQVISLEQVRKKLENTKPEAVIIRTLPNEDDKLQRHYSSTNPPYLEEAIGVYLREMGVNHLLIDTPSVDREEDGGLLLTHHAFWNVPENPRMEATITELIYVPNSVADGAYLLNLGFAPFENDASPSRPLLFEIKA
ncbi:cyclase family protein [bacterium SCSIO 12741]|nr:cyclase family protein [bacterium SCSIO 12741]